MLLDCDTADQGCHGGDPDNAYAYMAKNGINFFVPIFIVYIVCSSSLSMLFDPFSLSGITSETCAPYEAVGHDTGRKLSTSINIGNRCYVLLSVSL